MQACIFRGLPDPEIEIIVRHVSSLLSSIEAYWRESQRYSKTSANCLSPHSLVTYITHLWLSLPNFTPSSPCILPNSLNPYRQKHISFTPSSLCLSGLAPPMASRSLSPFKSKSVSPFWTTTPINTTVFLYQWQQFNRQNGGMLCRGWSIQENDLLSLSSEQQAFLAPASKVSL